MSWLLYEPHTSCCHKDLLFDYHYHIFYIANSKMLWNTTMQPCDASLYVHGAFRSLFTSVCCTPSFPAQSNHSRLANDWCGWFKKKDVVVVDLLWLVLKLASIVRYVVQLLETRGYHGNQVFNALQREITCCWVNGPFTVQTTGPRA